MRQDGIGGVLPSDGTSMMARREAGTVFGSGLAYSLVVLGFAGLALARLTMLFGHSMWLWGLSTQRFVSGPVGALTLAVLILPIVPPVGLRVAHALDVLGDALAAHRWVRLGAAGALALTVSVLDDRTWFTGDFLIRRGASLSGQFESHFQQALPLELMLFERLPRFLATFLPLESLVPRAVGVLAAFALGLTSIELGRDLGLRGVRLVGVAAGTALGGYLAVFTGLGKPAALLCVAVALTGLLALRSAHDRRAAERLGVVVFVTLLLHRAGLLLLPCWALVALSRRPPDARYALARRWLGEVLILSPLIGIAFVAGRDIHIVSTFDVPLHVVAASTAGGGHPWLHVLDLSNLVLLMVPLAPMLLLLASRALWTSPMIRPSTWILALLLPWVLVIAVVQPQQGVFRDLDVFSPGAVACSIACVYALCAGSTPSTAYRHLAALATATALATTMQTLACFHDTSRGLARVEAYLGGPPYREAGERARTWDFLALRYFVMQDWPGAARACDQSARLAPSPRMLIMLGIARTYVADFKGAREAYTLVLERSPREPVAWAGLMGIALRLQDHQLADSAYARLRTYDPHGSEARQIREVVRLHPVLWPRSPSGQ